MVIRAAIKWAIGRLTSIDDVSLPFKSAFDTPSTLQPLALNGRTNVLWMDGANTRGHLTIPHYNFCFPYIETRTDEMEGEGGIIIKNDAGIQFGQGQSRQAYRTGRRATAHGSPSLASFSFLSRSTRARGGEGERGNAGAGTIHMRETRCLRAPRAGGGGTGITYFPVGMPPALPCPL